MREDFDPEGFIPFARWSSRSHYFPKCALGAPCRAREATQPVVARLSLVLTRGRAPFSVCVDLNRKAAAAKSRVWIRRDGGFAMIRLLRLWRLGRQDLRLLWFALQHRSRPVWLWPAAALLGLNALDPVNFAIPFFGVVDDFVVLPLLLHGLLKLLPADIRAGFGRP
jgi:uncharacterized membrane protein YkvA (DUF1232 family)